MVFEYDDFLKNHLDNTRMVLTQKKGTAKYMAAVRAREIRLELKCWRCSHFRSSLLILNTKGNFKFLCLLLKILVQLSSLPKVFSHTMNDI